MYLSMTRENWRRPRQNQESPWSYSRRGRGRGPQNDLKLFATSDILIGWTRTNIANILSWWTRFDNVKTTSNFKGLPVKLQSITCADEQQRRIHPKNCGVRELQIKVLEQVIEVEDYKNLKHGDEEGVEDGFPFPDPLHHVVKVGHSKEQGANNYCLKSKCSLWNWYQII